MKQIALKMLILSITFKRLSFAKFKQMTTFWAILQSVQAIDDLGYYSSIQEKNFFCDHVGRDMMITQADLVTFAYCLC
jgi:hypothetical protein